MHSPMTLLSSDSTQTAIPEVLDIDVDSYFTRDIIDMILYKGLVVLLGLVLLVVGFYLSKYLVNLLKKGMTKARLDPSLVSFLASASGIAIKVLILISVASMIGVETSAFVAVIGAAGLAIGLALQGSLSNFAGGILILIFKPFRVGDIINAKGEEGEVERIDILNTKIVAYDNRVIIAPNGDLANTMLVNLSEKPLRRVEIPVRLSYRSDMTEARSLVLEALHEDSRVVKDPEPVVVMLNIEESHLSFSARGWCTMDDYFEVYWDCIEKITKKLGSSNLVQIPFPQRDVYIHSEPEAKNPD